MRNDFMQVTMEGALVNDPEDLTRGGANALAKLAVASNRRTWEGIEKPRFMDVLVRGRDAEICLQYLKKGRQVRVVGEMDMDSFVDKNGSKRRSWTILGDKVTFLSSGYRKEDEGADPSSGPPSGADTPDTPSGPSYDHESGSDRELSSRTRAQAAKALNKRRR